MKAFNGKILFLDRSDINTDEIIPAKYLTEITKEALKPYLLEDLKLQGFSHPDDIGGKSVIITRNNFGCGSSREHAPWALEVNGINIVIGEGFARIFRQNMYNCGMMAVSLPGEVMDAVFDRFAGNPSTLTTDLDSMMLMVQSENDRMEIPFEISDYDRALVESGGWVEYADKHY